MRDREGIAVDGVGWSAGGLRRGEAAGPGETGGRTRRRGRARRRGRTRLPGPDASAGQGEAAAGPGASAGQGEAAAGRTLRPGKARLRRGRAPAAPVWPTLPLPVISPPPFRRKRSFLPARPLTITSAGAGVQGVA